MNLIIAPNKITDLINAACKEAELQLKALQEYLSENKVAYIGRGKLFTFNTAETSEEDMPFTDKFHELPTFSTVDKYSNYDEFAAMAVSVNEEGELELHGYPRTEGADERTLTGSEEIMNCTSVYNIAEILKLVGENI